MNTQDTLMTLMLTEIHHFLLWWHILWIRCLMFFIKAPESQCQSYWITVTQSKCSSQGHLTTKTPHDDYTAKTSNQPTCTSLTPRPQTPTSNSKPASTHCTSLPLTLKINAPSPVNFPLPNQLPTSLQALPPFKDHTNLKLLIYNLLQECPQTAPRNTS